ncbi:probable RNA helicase armi [Drosophila ficusphila]|uniref:probable RNA helicase armi n=1 Tax=Drosophila ficusphila TaxID=30025 RepID=UPI0007E6A451|nr:probable RNA helicase armi [Drosophila ficusphila]
MISLYRMLFPNADREREFLMERAEQENRFLDQRIMEEEIRRQNEANPSGMDEALTNQTRQITQKLSALDINKDSRCCARKGVITSLTSNSGAIDKNLFFDSKAAEGIFLELSVGSVVEYLTFQKEHEEDIRVVKVQRIVEPSWEVPNQNQIDEALDKLKTQKAIQFNTEMRSVLGLICQRMASSIDVETEYGQLTVELDNIEINFVPQTGDRVRLECNIQLDDGYVDKQGEILQVTKVCPTRIEEGEKCTVERVYTDLLILGPEVYALKADVPTGMDPHLGDFLLADLIECQYSKFTRRAIKLVPLEKNFGATKVQRSAGLGSSSRDQAVSVTGVNRFISTELWQKQSISLQLTNNLSRQLRLESVVVSNDSESQLSLLEPLEPRDIVSGGSLTMIFEIHTQFMGEATENFVLKFDRFKVNRSFTVIVCETKEEAEEAERRLVAAESLLAPGRTVLQRSKFYANQVWCNQRDVVPGEYSTTKRRFVSLRLGFFEVPEKLRRIYLTVERKQEMLDSLQQSYPCVTESLNASNYVQRMGLYLHLEEIECFVSFRNYDRDRAHFLRDGEYLALQIENLAERRPSLVIGDVVRAINPWVEPNSKDNKSYEGIIHKVLFNRVLLKFNASFQGKYNGEDYRLEFYFSRFGYRKQHHAVSRILSVMGEQFLFPSKVTKRENPQSEVRMEGDDMYLYDSKLPWYNDSLNCIQKRAVYNILRGEAEDLPYVIFGPPGTGKTVTLVETILQLVRNLPGARILVGTPSNSAADLVTKRLIESKALLQGDFIRLVSHNLVERDLIPPELMSYCATIDLAAAGSCTDSMVTTESGLKLRCQMKFIGTHRITISTCATLGNFLQMGFPPGHFTHALLDEAGQCTEPETMVPIVMLSRKRCQVVLAGDPRQLQAITLNRLSSNTSLCMSFLERLLEHSPYQKDLQRFPESSGYNPVVLTKLLYNYRALPSIMSVYSKLFYDDELIPMVSQSDSRESQLLSKLRVVFEPEKDMPQAHGTFFYGITGENRQENDSPSWFNPHEVKEVFLMTIALYRANVSPEQIGILTPYMKQVKMLRNMFIGTDVAMPRIGSVEEFQGQERDIMLISTVRSSESILRNDSKLSLGFVRSKKRMNVAISRARAMMIVFGNPHLLAVDDCWRQLILFCANNNAYFGCELPESIQNQEEEDPIRLESFVP